MIMNYKGSDINWNKEVKKEMTRGIKKALVVSIIFNIILSILLVVVLNTTYSIEVNGTEYTQKIIDYIRGKE